MIQPTASQSDETYHQKRDSPARTLDERYIREDSSRSEAGPRSDHYVVNIRRCVFGNLNVGFTARRSKAATMGTCGPRLFIKGICANARNDEITQRLMTILKAAYDRQ